MPFHQRLDGLMKWIARPEWASGFAETLHDHLGTVCEEAGVDVDELEEALDPRQLTALTNCILEDFLTRWNDEDGRNAIDEYLKRRGWKEAVLTKRYLRALRDSEMSLYEVSDIVPGQSFLAHDLVRGGPPVLVTEPDVSHVLKASDRIATRIIELNGKRMVSSGTLPFDHALSEHLLREFESAKGKMLGLLNELEPSVDGRSDAAAEREMLDALAMALAPPLISAIWLESRLDSALGAGPPKTVTNEGDDIEFHDIRFPLLPGVSDDAVRARLDGIEALLRGEPDLDLWTLEARRHPPPRQAPDDASRDTVESATELDDDQILASIGLEEQHVQLNTNSAPRAARAQALLIPALDGLVGTPVTKITPLEQAFDAAAAAAPPPDSKIPPQARAELLLTALDQYYRALLDEPIAMLGGVSPREAAEAASERDKLVPWLKSLESVAASHKAAGNPLGGYDFDWMWAELGIEDLRK